MAETAAHNSARNDFSESFLLHKKMDIQPLVDMKYSKSHVQVMMSAWQQGVLYNRKHMLHRIQPRFFRFSLTWRGAGSTVVGSSFWRSPQECQSGDFVGRKYVQKGSRGDN